MKWLFKNWLLIFIILFGFFLRIFNIENNPPALYGDELTMVYDTYSLLKTGRDQTGAWFPITFSMGVGRPAGYVYASIPFVSVFGPSALGVRGLSIVSGVGIILLMYILGKKFFSHRVGVIAALLTSISPWDLSLSRGGFEAHFALFLILLGTTFFFAAQRKPLYYVFSAICFGLTIHTYPTYKLVLPLFLMLLIWFLGIKKLFNRALLGYIVTSAIILAVAVAVSINQTLWSQSEIRFNNINVFAQSELRENIIQKINFDRSLTTLPHSLKPLFHNKPVEYSLVLLEVYLKNFSLDFLLLSGDKNPRHNMASSGAVYIIEFFLIMVGSVSIWKKSFRTAVLVTAWLLLAPAATSLLLEPHFLRSAFMLPPLLILSCVGLDRLWVLGQRVWLNPIKLLIIFAFLVQFLFIINRIYFLSPNEYSRFWSYPAKLATQLALDNKEKFDYVVLSDQIDNIEFAYPVYTSQEPNKVISQYKGGVLLEGYNFKKYENVYLGYIPNDGIESFIQNLNKKALFIGIASQKQYLKNYKTLSGKDNLEALVISKFEF